MQDSADLKSRLQAFLAQHNTMTLATVDAAGAPHAAAVFYAADDALNLYFLSSPNSRHSQQSGSAAARRCDDPERQPGMADDPGRADRGHGSNGRWRG